MCLTIIVISGFYEPARHAMRYADTLAQAVRGNLVLLHVNRASLFDPYELVGAVGERLHQQELQAQSDTAMALRQLAQRLHVPTTVEMATDLLPNVARELAARYHPALFVLGQPDEDHPDFAGMATMCAELLRVGHFPVLAVPTSAPADTPPHRFLIAADREPFTLGPASKALCPALALLGTEFVVAYVSAGVDDDDGCAEALRAVRNSGLVEFSNPELQGYVDSDYAQGLLTAALEAPAEVVVMLARERSFMSELFHRSVTARLLGRCPVPVLVLPTAGEAHRPTAAEHAAATAIA
ncbi:universal stress protein [Hymenobacter properus]|uniref:Universal stress protein n=1 Tax=Hymenobacter properus TaxID=2791026 RepID=A0A931FNQ0_9BACT|nr:universal stress protein [Hymenobacter properus]MBF9142874.1 universal stress protein [Hymenobacter properus]MBR7721681.1 universal stress protein [Microvirga sp. SRT04]